MSAKKLSPSRGAKAGSTRRRSARTEQTGDSFRSIKYMDIELGFNCPRCSEPVIMSALLTPFTSTTTAGGRGRASREPCGWGADHEAHQHPGLDNTQCPGAGSKVKP